MHILGVELTGNEANICLLSKSGNLFALPDCRSRRFSVADINSAEQLRDFQSTVKKLIEDYHIDKIAIKQRPAKGKFAGSAIGFKLEAALQLIGDNIGVQLITAAEIKDSLKDNPMPIQFADTGLKKFQQPAFITAFVACWLS